MVVKLENKQAAEALKWLKSAVDAANLSPCFRAKCGAVIISHGALLGFGFNHPPHKIKLEYCIKDKIREDIYKNNYKKGPNDLTCCVHAEKRAILQALDNKPIDLTVEEYFENTMIYFVRLNDNREIQPSGAPYCTSCSKLVLEVGIDQWCLWHKEGTVLRNGDALVTLSEGIYTYNATEYNDTSFRYREK